MSLAVAGGRSMSVTEILHPSAERLASFASGQAAEQEAVEISQHLAECAACRTVVEALPADTLLSLLRKPAAASGAEGDTLPADAPALHAAATVTSHGSAAAG